MNKSSDQDYGTFTFSITDENNSDDKLLNKLIFTTNPKDTFYFKNKRGVSPAQQPPNPKYYIPFNINIFKQTFQKNSSSTAINEFFIPDLNTFITNTMKESLTPQTYIKFITTKSLVEQFINEYKTKYPDKKIVQNLTKRDLIIDEIKKDPKDTDKQQTIELIKRKYTYKIFIENIYLFLIKVLLTKHGTFIYLDTNKEKIAQDAAKAAAPAPAVQEEEQEQDEYEEEELYSEKEKPGLHFISYSGEKEEDFKSLKSKINKFIEEYKDLNEREKLKIDTNIKLELKTDILKDEDLKKITKTILYDVFLSTKKNKNEDLIGLSISETIYHEIVTKEVYENIILHDFFKLPKYDKAKLNDKFKEMKAKQVEDAKQKLIKATTNYESAKEERETLEAEQEKKQAKEDKQTKEFITELNNAKKTEQQAKTISEALERELASAEASYGNSMGDYFFIKKIRKGIEDLKKSNSIIREIIISEESIDEDIIKMLKFYFLKKEKETKRKKEIVISITITPENLKALDKLAILYSSTPSLEDIKNFQKKLQQQISNYVSKCQPTEELENKITEQCETICNKENPGMKEKLWCKICESYIRCVYDQNYTPQSELDAAVKEAAETKAEKTAKAAADAASADVAKAANAAKIRNPQPLPKQVKTIIKLTLPRQLEALRNKTQEELKQLEQVQAPIEGVPVKGVPVGPIVPGIRVGGRKTISKNKLKQKLNHSIKKEKLTT